MSGRIIIARHGRPDLDRTRKMTSQEYGDWWSQYDASGLVADERPPEQLVAFGASAATVLSSTLPRAIETARVVTGGAREVPADPIFVEAPLPPPPVPFLRLRPGAWGVVSRTFWFLGYAPPGVETHAAAWRRVARIAERLSGYAERGDVLLCAHGYLNWMIMRRLKTDGWRVASRDGGNNYWSWRVYAPVGQREVAGAAAAAAE